MHGTAVSAAFKYDELEVENVARELRHFQPAHSSFNNDESHVTAFRPISEAAHSWSHDKITHIFSQQHHTGTPSQATKRPPSPQNRSPIILIVSVYDGGKRGYTWSNCGKNFKWQYMKCLCACYNDQIKAKNICDRQNLSSAKMQHKMN